MVLIVLKQSRLYDVPKELMSLKSKTAVKKQEKVGLLALRQAEL